MKVRRRGSSRGPTIAVVIAVVVAALLIGGIVWWPRSSDLASRTPSPAQAPDSGQELRESDVPALDLPELGASDAFVREVAAGLSAHPRFAAWLVSDELVFRFVRTAVSVAHGQSPASDVDFMKPEGEFSVQEIDAALVIDPASYRRYDRLAQTFASLDTEGTAMLYRQLRPLFEEALAELGMPDASIDDLVAQAIGAMLAVNVPSGSPRVEPSSAVYAYTDARLESRSPAEKHLMRMGPENAARVQEKLREIRDAIWVNP